ncbi:UNVERIFIED_CONTAM: Phosphatidylinositol 3,4,5-trisphosphate 3-phosphatase and protein-tyrosine-phosphatase PTEN1 [Sesamum angustifolium]|uniref:Phosphatidylinositol 3,4,5-trisphosphate 3-phosphatase and protein-tyrosine-phosphatase PTEN1 n=1 Tax=Sesamum angustifolium TaxID=2727405 RepID=A0AAW2NMY2_9LAMI
MGLKFSKKESKTSEDLGLSFIQSQLVNCLWRNYLRNLVSKQRRRMLVAGYDLDMTYITDRVLAMSFPAERVRAMYRNPMWQVKSVLDMRHQGYYKVYNLCIEEDYDESHFHGRVERYPFDDNHVPPLAMIKEFLLKMFTSWLFQVIQSKVLQLFALHVGGYAEDFESFSPRGNPGWCGKSMGIIFGFRGLNSKSTPLTLHTGRKYFLSPKELITLLHTSICLNHAVENFRHIRLYDTVNILISIFVVVFWSCNRFQGSGIAPQQKSPRVAADGSEQIRKRCNKPRYYYSFVESEEGKKEVVEKPHFGDVRIIFYQKLIGSRLFYVCFNTAFITSSLLQFTIRDLDKVGKRRSDHHLWPFILLGALLRPLKRSLAAFSSLLVNNSSLRTEKNNNNNNTRNDVKSL